MALGNTVGMAKAPARHKLGKRFRKEPPPKAPENDPVGLPLLRAWRAKRGFTQDALGAAAGFTHGFISQLENGETNYVQTTVQALAHALKCEPWELLGVDPQRDENILKLWKKATEEQRKQIMTIVRAVVPDDGEQDDAFTTNREAVGSGVGHKGVPGGRNV